MRRTVVVREPEFDTHERALILAHLSNVADDGPYGVPLSKATAGPNFRAKEVPIENYAVSAAMRAQKAYYESYPEMRERADALMWSVFEVTD